MKRVPISRRTPLKRKTPLRSKAVKPKRKAKGPTVTQRKRQADTLFSRLIRDRDGTCQASDLGECSSQLQCAHIIPRRYLAVRWDDRNAVTLCARHHYWFTLRPVEWARWVTDRLGEETFRHLEDVALSGWGVPVPYAEVVAALKNGRRPTVVVLNGRASYRGGAEAPGPIVLPPTDTDDTAGPDGKEIG